MAVRATNAHIRPASLILAAGPTHLPQTDAASTAQSRHHGVAARATHISHRLYAAQKNPRHNQRTVLKVSFSTRSRIFSVQALAWSCRRPARFCPRAFVRTLSFARFRSHAFVRTLPFV
jgi:hypothetical protein